MLTFGPITNPLSRISNNPALTGSTEGSGLFVLLNVGMKSAIAVAAIFTLINFILAGYIFLGASGDPKKVQQAWEKIYISLIGLLVTSGAFVLAAIVGWLIFGDASILLTPRIFSPQ